MFEKASKLKLRFETERGNVTTEDLWDIPLVAPNNMSLDHIAKTLSRALKEDEEESFVIAKSTKNYDLELKFEIVKHIIKYKLQEKEKRENEAANKLKKEKILSILADKEDDALKGKSVASLKKMLDEL